MPSFENKRVPLLSKILLLKSAFCAALVLGLICLFQCKIKEVAKHDVRSVYFDNHGSN